MFDQAVPFGLKSLVIILPQWQMQFLTGKFELKQCICNIVFDSFREAFKCRNFIFTEIRIDDLIVIILGVCQVADCLCGIRKNLKFKKPVRFFIAFGFGR